MIDWCLEEALAARVDHEQAKAVQKAEATADAHARAQAALRAA